MKSADRLGRMNPSAGSEKAFENSCSNFATGPRRLLQRNNGQSFIPNSCSIYFCLKVPMMMPVGWHDRFLEKWIRFGTYFKEQQPNLGWLTT